MSPTRVVITSAGSSKEGVVDAPGLNQYGVCRRLFSYQPQDNQAILRWIVRDDAADLFIRSGTRRTRLRRLLPVTYCCPVHLDCKGPLGVQPPGFESSSLALGSGELS